MSTVSTSSTSKPRRRSSPATDFYSQSTTRRMYSGGFFRLKCTLPPAHLPDLAGGSRSSQSGAIRADLQSEKSESLQALSAVWPEGKFALRLSRPVIAGVASDLLPKMKPASAPLRTVHCASLGMSSPALPTRGIWISPRQTKPPGRNGREADFYFNVMMTRRYGSSPSE